MKHEICDSVLVITLDENVVAAIVPGLTAKLTTLFAGADGFGSVCVDMAPVQTIDSLGVNLLVGMYKESQKRNKPFRVINVSEPIHKLFDLYKLTAYFGVV